MRQVLVAVLLATPSAAAADTYFVAENAAGASDGTMYDNRADVATHNAGSGVFGDLAGHTVVLTGVIQHDQLPLL